MAENEGSYAGFALVLVEKKKLKRLGREEEDISLIHGHYYAHLYQINW